MSSRASSIAALPVKRTWSTATGDLMVPWASIATLRASSMMRSAVRRPSALRSGSRLPFSWARELPTSSVESVMTMLPVTGIIVGAERALVDDEGLGQIIRQAHLARRGDELARGLGDEALSVTSISTWPASGTLTRASCESAKISSEMLAGTRSLIRVLIEKLRVSRR